MAKRCIGIDISGTWVRAIQISRQKNLFHVEHVFNCPMRRRGDSPARMLQALIEHGFDRRCPVAVALPHDAVFLRSIEKQLIHLDNIGEELKSKIQLVSPVFSDDMLYSVLPAPADDGNSPSILAITDNSARRKILTLLSEADIRCDLLDAAIFAVHTAVTINHPETAAQTVTLLYADSSHFFIALTKAGRILTSRSFPLNTGSDHSSDDSSGDLTSRLLREIQLTWQAAYNCPIPENIPIYTAGHANDYTNLFTELENRLKGKVIEVDPFAHLTCPAQYHDDYTICLAEGLALRLLATQQTTGVNFLRDPDNSAHRCKPPRRQKRILIVLLTAIVLAYVSGIALQRKFLEIKYGQIKSQIRTIFRQTLPEEKNIVDEQAQLESHLQSARREYELLAGFSAQRPGPLQIWELINRNTAPNLGIVIDSLRIDDQAVQITAHGDSFNSIWTWQQRLGRLPQFARVEILNPGKDLPDEKVHFTVHLTLAGGEEK